MRLSGKGPRPGPRIFWSLRDNCHRSSSNKTIHVPMAYYVGPIWAVLGRVGHMFSHGPMLGLCRAYVETCWAHVGPC